MTNIARQARHYTIVGGILGFDINNIVVNRLSGYVSDIDYLDLTIGVGKHSKCNIKIDRINPITQKIIRIDYGSDDLYYWIGDKIFILDKEQRTLDIFYTNKNDALEMECKIFIDCVQNNTKPPTDGVFGMEVVGALDYIKNECIL